jgi:hypothetical protein
MSVAASSTHAIPAYNLGLSSTGLNMGRSADEICDELTDHMLDCEACLDSCLDGRDESSCPVYIQLRKQIDLRGGAHRSMLLAI